MGLIMTGILGVNHILNSKSSDKLDGVPVDVCVKGMIVAAFKQWSDNQGAMETQLNTIPVYNAASMINVSYDSMSMDIVSLTLGSPSLYRFGIPDVTYTKCVIYGWAIRIFRNIIPAVIVDCLLKLSGNQPRLMKIHRDIYNAQISLKHFYTRSFKFDNFKFLDLNLDIPKHEKEEFGIMRLLTYKEYFFKGTLMCLKIIFHETDEHKKIARRRYPYIYVVIRLIHLAFIYSVWKISCAIFTRSFNSSKIL